MVVTYQNLENLLEGFKESALLFNTSISYPNFWDQTYQILIKAFNLDLVCFMTVQADREISVIKNNDSQIYEELLTKTHENIVQVYESSSFSSEVVDFNGSYSIAIYPISVKNNNVAIMIIGYKSTEQLPKKTLDVYNAIAQLVGHKYHDLLLEDTHELHQINLLESVEESEARLKEIYDELHQTEARFKVIFDNAIDGMLLADIESQKFLLENRMICQMLGYSSEEIKKLSVPDLVPKESRSYVLKIFEKQIEGELSLAKDIPLKRKDGTIFFADINSSLITYANKTNILGIFRDITERKRTEDALRESEHSYRTLFENVPIGLYRTTFDGKILAANPALLEIFGFTSFDELSDLNVKDIASSVGYSKEQFEKIIKKQGEVKGFECKIKRNDGSTIYVLESARLITDQNGSVLYEGSFEDITERKLMQEKLYENEKMYKMLVENIPQKIFLKDKNSVYVSVNENFAKDLKISPEEVSEKTDFDFFPRELAEKYRADDQRIMESDQIEEIEEQYIQDGEERYVQTIKTPVHNRNGQVAGVLGIFHDITERKQFQTKLERERQQFLDAIEALNHPFYVINVHDYTIEIMNSATKQAYKSESSSPFCYELTHQSMIPCSGEGHICPIEKVKSSKKPVVVQHVHYGPEGLAKIFELHAHPIFDDSGEVNKVIEYSLDITERKKAEETLQQYTHDLGERVKELDCLYGVSLLFEKSELSVDELFQEMLKLIPKAWQYPDITQARITFQSKEFVSKNFQETPWKQQAAIRVSGKQVGFIEVYYLEEKPEIYEGPFLIEERDLIETLARELGEFLLRYQTDEALKEQTQKLNERVKELDCLYGIAQLVSDPNISIEEFLYNTVNLIPPAWLHPANTCARILYKEVEFKTANYQSTPHKLSFDIMMLGKQLGVLEVGYLVGKENDEERTLLAAIASKIGRFLEHKKMERKIQESEEKYRTILENMEEGYYEVDIAGNHTFFNDSMSRIIGYSKDEMIGMNNQQYMDEKTAKKVLLTFNEIYRTGESVKLIDYEIIRGDGAKRFIEASVSLIIDSIGEANGFRGIMRDITERKATENKLRESEEKYRHLVESSSDWIWEVDNEEKYVYSSPKVKDFLGYEPEEVIGKTPFNFMSMEEANRISVFFSENMLMRESFSLENLNQHKNGKFVWIETRGVPFFDLKGNFLGYRGVNRDITEKKKITSELEKSRDSLAEQVKEKTRDLLEEKKRIELIIKSISDGIIVLDSDGKVIFANKVIRDYFQEILNEDLMIGSNLLFHSNNVFIEPIKQLAMGSTQKIIIEPVLDLYLQLSSGGNLLQELSSLGTIIEVKNVTSFIVYDNMRKKFVSNISHELRTPISVVVQSISNLRKYRQRMNEEIYEQLMEVISSNASLLASIIEDLLSISTIDNKQLKLKWERYHPLDILNEVLKQMEPKRKAKIITINLEVDNTISLFGDVEKIAQVFRILIDNAIKYSNDRNKVIIRAVDNYKGKYNPQSINGTILHFIDYGIGIHEKDLPHIFERFFRSDSVKDLQGTGLGLSIAQEIVKLHDGDLFVESNYEKSSTFSVFLPLLNNKGG